MGSVAWEMTPDSSDLHREKEGQLVQGGVTGNLLAYEKKI